MRRRFLVPLLIPLLLTLGCASGGGGGFNLISLEEEWQLGAQLAGEIQRQMRVTRDPYISDLGRRIHA
ncbi:MAG TPA: peptidase M48, partial [Thermoanaerobaculia bacterium]|nr:peptidase M48 [Thermoanaerobaculia bacterium]